MQNKTPVILGVDPGYDRMGVCVLKKIDNKEQVLFSDCFESSKQQTLSQRIHFMGQKIASVIEQYKPDVLALEKLYFSNNQKTAMHVSQVRGVIMYEASQHGLDIQEYNPADIKITVTGHGRSDKKSVIAMVSKLVTLENKKMLDDEYDAIACALTCCVLSTSPASCKKEYI